MANPWSVAFAQQAGADFKTWQQLTLLANHEPVPQSQRLHFLQMAKLAKAHLCNQPKADPSAFQSSHAYIASTLPVIVQYAIQDSDPRTPIRVIRNRIQQAKHLFREIELLHPQVDLNRQRPDNCEYPWSDDSGVVHVPAEHHFEALRLADKKGGPELLKIVEHAIRKFCQ